MSAGIWNGPPPRAPPLPAACVACVAEQCRLDQPGRHQLRRRGARCPTGRRVRSCDVLWLVPHDTAYPWRRHGACLRGCRLPDLWLW